MQQDQNRDEANHVRIFDTTLRDGEQSPGCSMNLEEKLRVASALEAMGVDIIEAGFPIASNGDFEAVREIARRVKNSTVAGLSRANRKDIDRAWEALRHAARPRIHNFISTSPLHMEYKLQMAPDAVHDRMVESVSYARNLCDDVEWSPEDGTRTEHDFLCRCVESAITAGAGTINIPDTVGYTTPEEFHRQVECTINGIGERAGNAAMEEIVMAMKVRGDIMPCYTDVATEQITTASHLVSTITGFSVQPNKAIVGANAFAHESGIHQDGMLKHAGTYEIMTPESVGLNKSTLVMGKHSGRHAFKAKLAELGYELGDNEMQDAFQRFKDLADKKKDVYDEDIIALVDDQMMHANDRIQFVSLQVIAGSKGPQSAELELTIDGDLKTTKSTGDGPVDATFNAIKTLFPHEARLQLYQVHAVTEGTDAQAQVTVRLEEDGKTVNGQGADTDTLVASSKAYIHALNKLLVKREKSAPAALSA
jgi:2-isopropylmalate synthase